MAKRSASQLRPETCGKTNSEESRPNLAMFSYRRPTLPDVLNKGNPA